jgi:holo-[acyl-carrier protein] synthase
MTLSSGIDMVEIERIQRAIDRYGDRFLQRVFTSHELSEAGRNPASLAARFAAKEAVAKALGCGIGPVSWQEIETRRDTAGRPVLFLHGAAWRLAVQQNLHDWSISLSHSQKYAIAVAVAIGG